ncbi:hypothetical protein KASHIRA_00520 [Serratia phage vB_SmaM-Kashira]|nr:hypothetical protein KASHIRA_00520 [Serratia phage vB_SmaM-Kashira]
MAETTQEYVRTFDFELDGYPWQTFRVVLDSVTYEVTFVWNERGEYWQFSFGNVGTAPTFTCKLTCFVNILDPYRYKDNIPAGNLILLPLRNIGERVGRYSIGIQTPIQMVYASRVQDVEAIE